MGQTSRILLGFECLCVAYAQWMRSEWHRHSRKKEIPYYFKSSLYSLVKQGASYLSYDTGINMAWRWRVGEKWGGSTPGGVLTSQHFKTNIFKKILDVIDINLKDVKKSTSSRLLSELWTKKVILWRYRTKTSFAPKRGRASCTSKKMCPTWEGKTLSRPI